MSTQKPQVSPTHIDPFLPYLADLPLRDQREMMERPFFSLAKSKRTKPIDYRSPDGKQWVHVSPNPDYGMATIWDADILMYCISILADMARRGINDIPRKLNLMPYDLLRAIGRPTTGRSYELLGQALDRLVSTTIKTNIRAQNRREATFSWLDGWSQLVDDRTERVRGMTIELSNWLYEGVLMTGGVLSVDRAYFDISGGRERWLYKVARKHAGGAGEAGFAISMPTLFEKSGAEGLYRRFKFEISKLVERNELPGYSLTLETVASKREPIVRMHRIIPPTTRTLSEPSSTTRIKQKTIDTNTSTTRDVTATTFSILRSEFPGWDFETLHQEFRSWIDADPSRTPANYQQAFIGFVRRYDAKNKHILGR
ncbi:replication initiator protein A [Swingsia samuiensis]|uniref:Plasmid replication initiator protein n=1 Tax=Swingsia samuiensis TaxID=1293412 RepID=A0A4Y6UP09_9PROT|nr:replication initiator protein A [Swingsia samuiensis]QDH18087.1 plasmid replication initiator protein [Swingsia samuiensis]